jgi:hypothetical protein
VIWLLLAAVLIAASAYAAQRDMADWRTYAAAGAYSALLIWLYSQAGMQIFDSGGEDRFLGYFFLALILGLAGVLLAHFGVGRLAAWLPPLAALLYALGMDVFRPDAYAYVPAAIVAALMLALAWQAFRRFSVGGATPAWAVGLPVVAFGLLLYAAVFKQIDRTWPLAQSYLLDAGVFLFVASALWDGWERVFGQRRVAAWAPLAAGLFGQGAMVVAAFIHYREFL